MKAALKLLPRLSTAVLLDNFDDGSLEIIGQKIASSLNEKQLAEFRNKNIGFDISVPSLASRVYSIRKCVYSCLYAGKKPSESESKAKEL